MELSVLVTAMTLGFLLGLKHATEADHVVAVSTIVSEYRNAGRGLWVGASWGLGHTTPLLLVGIVILLIQVPFPEHWAMYLEYGVGVMLVLLGLQVLWNLYRRRLHIHGHSHPTREHVHLHSHEESPQPGSHHSLFNPGRPFFRPKSYVVGVVHGMAGSAAVMLLVLTTIPSFWAGLTYILLFGVGTVLAMGGVTLLMGVPFAVSGRFQRINSAVAGAAGVASIAFGALLMYEIGVVEGLLV